MATRKNEFLEARVVKADFSAAATMSAAQSCPSGVFIPGGAIVTGVTYIYTTARTVAGNSATASVFVANTALSSSIGLVSSINLSVFPAQTIPYVASLVSAAGMYVPVSGELILTIGADAAGNSVGTSVAPSVFVGYIA
jgi:hypothetical protein